MRAVCVTIVDVDAGTLVAMLHGMRYMLQCVDAAAGQPPVPENRTEDDLTLFDMSQHEGTSGTPEPLPVSCAGREPMPTWAHISTLTHQRILGPTNSPPQSATGPLRSLRPT